MQYQLRGRDKCSILGYHDSKQGLQEHVDEEDKKAPPRLGLSLQV